MPPERLRRIGAAAGGGVTTTTSDVRLTLAVFLLAIVTVCHSRTRSPTRLDRRQADSYTHGSMTPPTVTRLSAHNVMRIAVYGFTHPRTVRRAYRGDPVRSTTAARIIDAAQKLGLPEPNVTIAAPDLSTKEDK